MKGDFSRRTFDATKHYSAVLVEQGRLLTDADSEEEHRILTHRTERATADIVGTCGGPLPHAGFALDTPDGAELRIGAGPYYATGTLLENESATAFTDQPDRFDVPWPLPAGRHALVLETWRRLVTALDDPSIREVALGGPTTSSRERVIWQVGAVPVDDDWDCADGLPAAERTTGELAARAQPDETLSSPCLIPPQAGYTGLENQFYRVEIFDSGAAYDLAAAPGTVAVTDFPAGQPNRLTVAALGPLTVGDAVEVFRTGAGSDPLEATFGHVTDIDGLTLTLSTGLPAFGPTDGPTLRRVGAAFVVSRDNGAVVTAVEAIDGVEVTVHDTGPDDVLGFAVGQLVELSDDRIELEGRARQLRQIADIDQTRRVVVLRTPAEALDADPSGVDPARHPKLRRWDAAGAVRFRPDGSGWIHLESGNQVRFVDGHHRAGDYWTFPARAATVDADSGTIEWPQDGGVPALRPPFGIARHRCVLGGVDVDAEGSITAVTDCRTLFPPLTSLRNLLYVGGDGQEGSFADAVGGFIPLPAELVVRVANGGLPVAGATVRFTLTQGAGRLEGTGTPVDLVTDDNGLAICRWEIDDTEDDQRCTAHLLDRAGNPIAHQVVRFSATIDRDVTGGGKCCCVSIGKEGDYPTVIRALTDLLDRGVAVICLCLMPGDHEVDELDFQVERERKLHLSIEGCGRGTRILLRGNVLLSGWLSVRLVDLDILMGRATSVALLDVAEVEVRGCRIAGTPGRVGLLRVYGAQRLHVAHCVLVSRQTDTFAGPRRFLDGLDELIPPWGVEDEAKLLDVFTDVARGLAGLDDARRGELAAALRERLQQQATSLSSAEVESHLRLAALLDGEREPTPFAVALDQIAQAATLRRPGIALEVGSRPDAEKIEMATSVSIVISDNLVAGIISCYGLGSPDDVVSDDTLRKLGSAVLEGIFRIGTGGDVQIRGNRFTRLALGREMIALLDSLVGNQRPVFAIFESLHLTDNVVDGIITETLARHTSMTTNDFTLAAVSPQDFPDELMVAHVLGDTATYTGNHGRSAGIVPIPDARVFSVNRARTEAANLELTIQ